MKPTIAATIFLLAGLSEPTFADAAKDAMNGCTLFGPPADAPAACKDMRVAFRSEVSECMAKTKTLSELRSGRATGNSLQTDRTRFLVCDAAVRRELGLGDR